jgi:DNA polymerase-1
LQKKLIAGKEDAFLSRSLFTLSHIDCSNFDTHLTDLKLSSWESARDLLERLELKSLLPAKPKLSLENEFFEEKAFCDKLNLKIITLESELDSFLERVSLSEHFSFDLETTGLNWIEDQILGISFCLGGETFYLPVNNQLNDLFFSKKHIFEKLKKIFQNPKITKIAHNIKFDAHFLSSQAGIKIIGQSFDTAIAARILLPEWIKVGLKSLSQTHLNLKRASFSDLAKEFGSDFQNIPLEKIAKYAALDAFQTLQLYKIFLEKLSLNQNLLNSFKTIEMPLSFILLQMEECGILFDSAKAEELNSIVGIELEKVVGKITGFLETLDIDHEHKDLIKSINLNSPKQLQILLFDILKLPVPKVAGYKKVSTNVETLNQLALIHPVPGLILQHRQLYKLKSTYLEALPTHRNKSTGAIHTNYSQLIVSTGRLSSLDPNLQNIPQASGKINVRDCFVSRPGYYFLSADYSQIELRVLAYLSKDKALISSFQNNEDIHNKTACTIFKKTESEVLPEERSLAKKINFSVLYGLSPFSLSLELKISVKIAQEYINAFFETYPSVRPWMDELIKSATENGFITTISGRQRWFSNLSDGNMLVAKSEQRAAINAVIQGSAADIVKLAMIKLSDFLRKEPAEYLNIHMLLQVHDEILFECPNPKNKGLNFKLTKIMETVIDLGFPLTVNTKVGYSWGTLT